MPSFIEREYADPVQKTLQPDSIWDEITNRPELPASTSKTQTGVQIHKKPKNIIRCGDGYLEEYSTDEETIQERKNEEQAEKEWNTLPYENVVSTNNLSWKEFTNYHFWRMTRRFQWTGYSIGMFFSELFGITAPRFGAEMRLAERMQQEENERKEITKKCYVGLNGEIVEEELPASPKHNSVSPEILKHKPVNISLENLAGGDNQPRKFSGVRDNLNREMDESKF